MKLLLCHTLIHSYRHSAISDRYKLLFVLLCNIFLSAAAIAQVYPNNLLIADSGYFEKRGLNIFVFSNHYGLFGDEKANGIEIIHHGVRTATNGDVRLNPTPEQWDSIPTFIKRSVNKNENSIEAFLQYPAYDFSYTIKTTSE